MHIHAPSQVPQQYSDRFAFIAPTDKPTHNRQRYHAMVNFADAAVGNLTALLKSKGMWDQTLLVFTTDNGGPIYANGSAGANNYPLKGGKMNNWEGGIRGNSFVSGGFIPAHMRGHKYEGLVTAWDWYHTFCRFAGVDPTDHRAAAADLPPLDSFDHSGLILGTNLTSPRTELPIGTEPRASNVSTAPSCRSYYASPLYEDKVVDGDEFAPLPIEGKHDLSTLCSNTSTAFPMHTSNKLHPECSFKHVCAYFRQLHHCVGSDRRRAWLGRYSLEDPDGRRGARRLYGTSLS